MSRSGSPSSRRLIASRRWCGVSFGLRPSFTDQRPKLAAEPEPAERGLGAAFGRGRGPSLLPACRAVGCVHRTIACEAGERRDDCRRWSSVAAGRAARRAPRCARRGCGRMPMSVTLHPNSAEVPCPAIKLPRSSSTRRSCSASTRPRRWPPRSASRSQRHLRLCLRRHGADPAAMPRLAAAVQQLANQLRRTRSGAFGRLVLPLGFLGGLLIALLAAASAGGSQRVASEPSALP
jgi:hypothetical protein